MEQKEQEKKREAIENIIDQELKILEEGGDMYYQMLSRPELRELQEESRWRIVSPSESVKKME